MKIKDLVIEEIQARKEVVAEKIHQLGICGYPKISCKSCERALNTEENHE